MEVAAVDERDLDRRTPQLRHRLQTAKTSPDDDDVAFLGPRGAHSRPLFKRAPGQFPLQARPFAGCQPVWATEHDWRKCEARLNALPQFTTEIDGLVNHFIQVKSRNENYA
jgi:hypothetical protein